MRHPAIGRDRRRQPVGIGIGSMAQTDVQETVQTNTSMACYYKMSGDSTEDDPDLAPKNYSIGERMCDNKHFYLSYGESGHDANEAAPALCPWVLPVGLADTPHPSASRPHGLGPLLGAVTLQTAPGWPCYAVGRALSVDRRRREVHAGGTRTTQMFRG